MRSFSTNVKPLAWDTFRQEATELGERLENIIKESKGSLDRAVAESLVDEIINLRRANPRRRDELLPTLDFEDTLEDEDVLHFGEDGTVKSPLVEHYEALFNLASTCTDAKLALVLYDEIQQRGVPITTVMLNSALKVCVDCGDPSKAEMIFNSNESSDAVDATTLEYAMQSFVSLGDREGMSRIYAKLGAMATSSAVVRGELVRRTIGTYILGLVQLGYPTLATKAYEVIRPQNPDMVALPSVQMALIEAYSDLRNYAAACDIFTLMLEKSIQIPHTTIARVIYCYMRLSNEAATQIKSSTGKTVKGVKSTSIADSVKFETKAKEIYAIFNSDPHMARLWPWDRFISLSKSREGLPRATPLSEDDGPMRLLEEAPKKENYEAALIHYAMSGNFVFVERLLKEYAERFKGAQLPTPVNAAIFKGSTRLGNAKYLSSLENLDDESAKVPPSLARSLLNFYISKSNITKSTDVMNKIIARYPSTIEAGACEEILKLFLTAPHYLQQRAKSLFYQLNESFPDSTLTVDFFNIAMTLFTHTENAQGINDILEQIKRRSLVPNSGTYTALMELYLRKPDYRMVVETYAQMIDQKLEPNTGAVMALIIAMGESKALAETKSVLFLQEQLERYNVEPSEDFVQVLKKSTATAKNPTAFGVLLRTLTRKLGVALTAGNYVSWLAALLQCDQINRALELAEVVVKESRHKPELLTLSFCETLSLYVAKEAGDDLDSDSVNRWINHRSVSSKPLSVSERIVFEKDLKLWNSLFPDELPGLYTSSASNQL